MYKYLLDCHKTKQKNDSMQNLLLVMQLISHFSRDLLLDLGAHVMLFKSCLVSNEKFGSKI